MMPGMSRCSALQLRPTEIGAKPLHSPYYYGTDRDFAKLQMEFKLNDILQRFGVECKWRKNYYKGGIEWSNPDQLANYRGFAIEKRISVFIVIGVGGTSSDPNEVYILPLDQISDPFLSRSAMAPFRRNNTNRNFYFDQTGPALR
jgi:hypothetical protein